MYAWNNDTKVRWNTQDFSIHRSILRQLSSWKQRMSFLRESFARTMWRNQRGGKRKKKRKRKRGENRERKRRERERKEEKGSVSRYYRSALLFFAFSEWGWHGYYCAAYFSKTTAPISAERQLPVTPCARTAPRPRRIRRYQVHTRTYSSAYCRYRAPPPPPLSPSFRFPFRAKAEPCRPSAEIPPSALMARAEECARKQIFRRRKKIKDILLSHRVPFSRIPRINIGKLIGGERGPSVGYLPA